MLEIQKLEYIKDEVKKIFANDYSGHDYFHTIRVYNTAATIGKEENANMKIVQLASLLHDVDDYKLFHQEIGNCKRALEIMTAIEISDDVKKCVCNIIKSMSFKGKDSEIPDSIEGKVVQDADRLDAIGAVGMARAFAYGGTSGRAIYDPNIDSKVNMTKEEYVTNSGTTINHFYEKLLLLKDMMNTESAKTIAEKRHSYMIQYLEEFYAEWNGER